MRQNTTIEIHLKRTTLVMIYMVEVRINRFMFAVYVSNVLFTLVNLTMVLNAIIETKSVLFI
ncbi:hypothetical protein ACHK7U_00740, partial [Staphylococcus hominis]